MSLVLTPGNLTFSASGVSIGASTVTGGSGSYTISWSNSGAASTVVSPQTLTAKSNLGLGTYTLTVADTANAGLTASYTFDGYGALTTASATLTFAPTQANMNNAASVSASGQYFVVGAPGYTGFTAVYMRNTAEPVLATSLVFLSNAFTAAQRTTDLFGYAVAIDGVSVAVTSPSNSSIRGLVSVYDNTSVLTFTTAVNLVASDGAAGDRFGRSVSISGNVMAIGADLWSNKSPAVSAAGCVYIFTKSAGVWTQAQQLVAPDQLASAQFGGSVSLVGGGLLVGSPTWGAAAKSYGRVYYFTSSGGVWSYHSTLSMTDFAQNDNLGSSVALSNESTRAAISRPGTATVYVMRLDAGPVWTTEKVVKLTKPATSISCCMYSGMLAVGSSTLGISVLLKRTGTTWIPYSGYTYSSAGFGACVSITDKYLFVGAPNYASTFANNGFLYTLSYNPIVASGTATNPIIAGQAVGSISTSITSGGTAPYTSSWSALSTYTALPATPATSVSSTTGFGLSGLTAGQYTQVITDAVSQTLTTVYTVTQLAISPGVVTHCTTAAPASGTIAASTVSGGSGSYTVSWTVSTGASAVAQTTLAALSGLKPGRYVLTVVDSVYKQSYTSFIFDVGTYVAFTTTVAPAALLTSAGFGTSVSVAGNWMVVGAPTTSNFSTNAGTAVLYFYNGSTWVQQSTIFGQRTTSEQFGWAVCVDSNTVAVAQKTATGVPTLWIFNTAGTLQQTRFSGTDTTTGKALGLPVLCLQNDTTLVTSDQLIPSTNTVGEVYIFAKNAGTWSQQQSFFAPVTTGNDLFGTGLAIDGSWLAIGAPGYKANTGAVFMYTKGGDGVWSYSGTLLTAPDAFTGSQFGTALSMRNGYLAVGASAWASKAPVLSQAGAVYIYTLSGSTWSLTNTLNEANRNSNRKFGSSVTFTPSNYLIVGTGTVTNPYDMALFMPASDNKSWYRSVSYNSVSGPLTAFSGSDKSMVAGHASASQIYISPAITTGPLAITPGSVSAGSIASTTVIGGTPPYSVSWTGLSSSSLAAKSGLAIGSYTVTVTDSLAATTSVTYSVTVGPAAPIILPGAVTNATAFGTATGSIALSTFSQTAGPYTYLWTSSGQASTVTNPSVLEAKSGLLAGSYTFAVTDGAGLTSSYTFTILQPIGLSAGAVTNATYGASNGSIGATGVAGGNGVYSYSWVSTNGGTTIASQTPTAKSGLAAGTYRLTVTDTASYSTSLTYTLLQSISYTGGAVTSASTSSSSDGAIAALTAVGGTGSGYTYTWSSSDTNATTIATQDGSAKTGLATATYTLVIADSGGFSSTFTFYVGIVTVITFGSITNATSYGSSTGSITGLSVSGGTGTYVSYLWTGSGGATPITTQDLTDKTSLAAGVYTLTVTDDKGLVTAGSATLLQPINLTPGTVINATTYGTSTGSIGATTVAGGNGVYTYSWVSTNGGTTIAVQNGAAKTSLAAGTYTLTVTDTASYSKTQVYTVLQPIQITAGTITNASASGASDGAIGATTVAGGNGVYSYSWASTGTAIATQDLTPKSGLTPGAYTLTVSDTAGFSTSKVYTVLQPINIVPGAVTNTSVYSGSDGAIGATIAQGGNGVYSYSWTTTATAVSQNASAKSALAAGTYTVTVTDTASYSKSFAYVVSFPVTVSRGAVTHCSSPQTATGSITACSVIGGTAPYTVVWSNSSGATVLTNDLTTKTGILQGRYTLTATDSVGQTTSEVFDVGVNTAALVSTLSGVTSGTFGDNFGSSVSSDGLYIAIGAANVRVSSLASCGMVYVYKYISGAYSNTSTKTPQAPAAGLQFGIRVCINGNSLFVVDGNKQVQVYYRSSEVWNFTQTLTQSPANRFGQSVAISGARAVVSDPNYNGNGCVYVYSLSGSTWSYAYRLTASPSISETFGWYVALSGSTLAVAAPDTNSTYVFTLATSAYTQNTKLIGPSGAGFGQVVALNTSANYVFVGAPLAAQTSPALANSGAVFIYFNTSGNTWTLVSTLNCGVNTASAYMGYQLASSGNSMCVYGGTSVYRYELSGTAWLMSYVTGTVDTTLSIARGSQFMVVGSPTNNSGQGRVSILSAQVIVSGGAITNVAVYGASTGAIAAITATGGSGVYSYAWTSTGTAITTQDATAKTSLAAGVYSVVVDDGMGQSTTQNFAVLQPIVVTGGAITHVAVYGQNTGAIAAITAAGGNGVYTYAWSSSGGGSTVSTQDATAKSNLAAGIYTVVVTDTAAYSKTTVFTVLQPIAITGGAVTNVAISGNSTGAIAAVTALGGNGVYSYAWSTTASTPITTQNASAKSGLATGVYTLVVTDTASYSTTRTFTVGTVINVTAGTVTAVSAFGGSDGSISDTTITGGSGTFVSYAWTSSGGGSPIASQDLSAKSGLTAGIYTLVITDDMGTTATQVYTVLQPLSAITGGAVTNATPYGSSTGAIAAISVQGGNGVYSYAWTSTATAVSQNASAKSALAAGTFTVTVSDGTGYSSSKTFTVLQPINITGGAITPVSVYGASTGAIAAVTALGGNGVYSYAWSTTASTPITTQNASAKSGLATGVYTLVVTDTASYSTTKAFTVLQPIAVTAAGTVANATAYGTSTGSIGATTVAGGNGVYTYAWVSTNGGTTIASQTPAAKTSLAAGTYTLTITDTASYSVTQVYTILQPINITGGALTPVSVYGASTGAIAAITAAGGNGVYSYAWTSTGTPITTQDATAKTSLAAGVYTVVVTDTASFSTTKVFTVLQPIVVTGGAITPVSVYGTSTGAISAVTVAGGNGVYTYAWTSSGGGSTISTQNATAKSSLAAGVYTLVVTDTASYSTTRVFTVLQPIAITGGALTAVSVYGASTGAITALTPAGGNGVYSYAWTSTGTTITTQDATAKTSLSAGNYTVVVTDTASYSTTKVFTILQPIVVTAAGAVTNASSYGSATGSIGVTTVAGGNGVYTYTWVSTNGGSAISPQDLSAHNSLTTGTYTLTITDTASYSKTQVYTVLQPIQITAGAVTAVSTFGAKNGSIAATTVAGGNGVYTYTWTIT